MIKKGELKATRTSKTRSSLLIGIVLCIYFLENIAYIQGSTFIYIFKPLIWCGITGVVWIFPRIRAKGKIRFYGMLKWWAGYLAVFYVTVMFLGGIVDGFGKSPYDLAPAGMLKNLVVVGVELVGKELVRAYLVNSLSQKNLTFNISVITIFMTMISLPINFVIGLKSGMDIIQYIGSVFIPELSKNILATYLVYTGGAKLSIIYLGILQGFTWVSPVLPDLKWITKALIGSLCPVFSLMFIQYMYESEAREQHKHIDKENPLGLIVTGVISIFIIWFAVGVFPISPKVIATGSMKPMIHPGDVVLVKKLSGNDLKCGDVIQFKKDNIYIFHRIISIEEVKNEKKYKTKGDNNSSPDGELVNIEKVRGKVIKVIPKIGWPTLLIKSKNDVPKEKVEF